MADPADEATASSDLDDWDDEGERDVKSDAYASLTGAPAAEPQPLDLEIDQAEAHEDGEQSGDGGDDELLLDASRLAEDDGPVTPLIPGRRRSLLSGSDEPEQPSQRSGMGSTLFERMANLSRGSKATEDKDDEDAEEDDSSSISIPRFLGRQNNQ